MWYTKNILVVLLLALIWQVALSQHAKSDLEQMGLKGKVKNISKIYSSCFYGTCDDTSKWSKETCDDMYFNREGNMTTGFNIQNRSCLPELRIIGSGDWWDCEYDRSGRKTRARNMYSLPVCKGDEGHNLEDEYKYKYNNKGQLIEETVSNEDVKFFVEKKIVYKYDVSRLVEKEIYEFGELKSKYVFDYDSIGNNISEKEFSKDGVVEDVREYTFNSRGLKIEEQNTHWNEFREKRIYTYDETGKMIQMKLFVPKADSAQRKKTDADLTVAQIEKFNEQGDITEFEHFRIDSVFSSASHLFCEYENDKYGNWISQVVTSDGKIVCVIKRRIIYYK